jgi:hypothetical protein
VEGQVRFLVPLLLVFASFIGVLVAYSLLRLNGTDTGPLDELVTGLGTAMAALAAPTAISWSSQRSPEEAGALTVAEVEEEKTRARAR